MRLDAVRETSRDATEAAARQPSARNVFAIVGLVVVVVALVALFR